MTYLYGRKSIACHGLQAAEMPGQVPSINDTSEQDWSVKTFHAVQVKRYLPYAAGSRGCLGMPQAQVTMLATLGALLSRFSFRLAEKVGGAATTYPRLKILGQRQST